MPDVGAYTMRLTVTDTAGNTNGMDCAAPLRERSGDARSAKFNARWKQSRVTGTLVVKGTVPVAGTYALDVLKGKARKFHFAVKLTARPSPAPSGCPRRSARAAYRVVLDPSPKFVKAAELAASSRLPPRAWSTSRNSARRATGKAVRKVRASRSLFASFHFAALPAGTIRLTWYRTYKGRRTILKSATRKPVAKMSDSLALRGRRGTITAVLTRSGKIIAQGSVKAT